MNLLKLGLSGLMLVAFLHVNAQVNADTDNNATRSKLKGLSIGVGVGHESSPYRDWDENETSALPFISYERGNVFFEGSTLGYTVFEEESDESGYFLALIGNIELGGYKASDSPFFAGMADRDDTAFELGIAAGVFTSIGLFEFTVVQDVADAHDGLIADLSYSLPFGDEQAGYEISPYLGATYYSDDYNDYYYGVRANEATSIRPAYQADGGVNPYIGIGLFYRINAHWGLVGDLRYEKLNSNIEDSPLIEEDNVTSAMLGITYSF